MSNPYLPNNLPAPVIEPGDEHYWEQARAGKLAIKACKECNKYHHYPRALCPFCFGETEWKESTGKGTIYSLSIMSRGNPNPYCIAYVTLEEGVTMMTQIVDCDFDDLKIGQAVELVFKPTVGEDTPPVPVFKPV
ncbi:Zn-ribbon domain-containing OB-fold protein [Orrella sp. 11846]|uniref:Zn-ribbon domain-containing OB-fold protein n=1 Tax=Orrella sp. 11846 TaxID=3409913 RepID=UPI003B5CD518